jgi:hypothetical protein
VGVSRKHQRRHLRRLVERAAEIRICKLIIALSLYGTSYNIFSTPSRHGPEGGDGGGTSETPVSRRKRIRVRGA